MSKRILPYILIVIISSLLTAVFQPWSHMPALAQQGNCQTFKETGHTLCGKFLTYWQQHGGLAQQGFPVSDEVMEKSDTDGKTYTMQYFQRAVFELHPENQPPNDVLLSLLGTFYYSQRHPVGTPVPPPPGPKIYQLGERAEIKPGITVTFTEAKVNGDNVEWRGSIRNDTDGVFNLRAPDDTSSVKDDTGKIYTTRSYVNIPNGDIPARTSKDLYVSMYLGGKLSPTLKYLDLYIDTISGFGPFVWRRTL